MTKKSRRKKKDLADEVGFWLTQAGLEHERELRFAPPRRWRFDIAFPEQRVAVELHGGEFINGRHVRGYGLKNDCEKARAAARLGWKLYPFVGSDVNQDMGKVIEEIREAVHGEQETP